MQRINLSDHFTYRKLLRFTLPSIVMMVFTSIYGVVDGFFVSNFAGDTAFTAVNLILPFSFVLGAFGFMFGAGGSALIGKTLGEGKQEKASRIFSLLVYSSFILGVVLSFFGILFLKPAARALGARGEIFDLCIEYGTIVLLALPAFMIQFEFQSFFAVAEKTSFGLFVTVCAGFVNILLDALFVAGLGWGVKGAAWATACSQIVGAAIPLCYFLCKNNSPLRLGKTVFDKKALLKTATNGSSELMINIALSLVSMFYNSQLLKYVGNYGVAAYGVLMYVGMIFNAIFIGYSVGAAPIVSFHFGAKNKKELQGLLRKSSMLIGIFSLAMFLTSLWLSYPLSKFYVGYNAELLRLTHRGFIIFSFSFIFMGYAIYFSSFFTALNDGLTSALISFLRALVFQTAAVFLLPLWLGVDGIWLSLVIAELMSMVCSLFFLFIKQKRYGY